MSISMLSCPEDEIYKQPKKSRSSTMELNKPVGAVEILSGILTADPRPFVLFSQLQEWTATTKKKST
jgi:hypothetical protein